MSIRRPWLVAAAMMIAAASPSTSAAQAASDSSGSPSPTRATRGRTSPSSGAVALTLEGGGSLGSYEAGLSWAIVEAFRQRRAMDGTGTKGPAAVPRSVTRLPRLDMIASAGASAGSINALLASVAWCSDAPPQPAESSAFWKAWISTGLSELRPEPRSPGWAERAVFSRVHFRDFVLPEIHRAWSTGGSVPDCQVTFGATVTKFETDSVEVANALYARNQRFASAAVVRPPARAGEQPRFTQPVLGAQSFGPTDYVVRLPDRNGEVDASDIERLVIASSAYPLAFEPFGLRSCRGRASSTSGASCTAYDSTAFLDGGVFDNGPLALAYDLAHATEPRRAQQGLYLLYVTPDRRRFAGDPRRDMHLFRERAGDAAAQKLGITRRPEGVDAGLTIISNFVPAAREYELQLAARMLPQTTQLEQQLSKRDAAMAIAQENERRMKALADSEHAAHARVETETDSTWKALLAGEVGERRLAQRAAAFCRVTPAECGSPTMIDSVIAQFGVDSTPPPPVWPILPVKEPTVAPATPRDSVPDASFEHLFFVSTRWHPLAGEWLSHFGAFLGQPLREYDYWVGAYDGLTLIARDAICGVAAPGAVESPRVSSRDSSCAVNALRAMIDDPPIALSESGRMALNALFRAEHPEGVSLASRDDGTRDREPRRSREVVATTEHDVVLLAVIDAMNARMLDDSRELSSCKSGSFVERSACKQGIEAFFHDLRENKQAMEALERSAANCDKARPLTDGCFADETFVRIVKHPGAELDKITEFVLHRLDETTPIDGSTKAFVLIANAAYYSTNESQRSGIDYGSTSLPSSLYSASCDSFSVASPTLRHLRSCSQKALRFYPSSVGLPLFPSSAQYAEWTVRYNWAGGWAVGAVARLMTSNGRRLDNTQKSPRMIEVPGIRAEYKTGNILVPTIGIETGYWMDSAHRPFGQPAAARASYGATVTALASKLRFSVTRIPDGYRADRSSQKWLWTGGIGDVNGMVYWLWRLTTE